MVAPRNAMARVDSTSRTRPAVFGSVVWLVFMLLGALVPALSSAADVVLGFDDVPSGTSIDTRYHDRGVDLGGAGGARLLIALQDAQAHSSPNLLDISRGYPNEFPGAYLQGKFVNPHHTHVGVFILGRGFPGSPLTGQTTLQAYDVSGNIVATTTRIAPVPGSPFSFIGVTSGAANIARFDLSCSNDLLFVDDLTFDDLTATPAPDFAVIASRVEVPIGGSGSTTVVLRRFNGSSGDVLYSVSNLPPGVSVTQASPNPMSGPDGSTSFLVLTASPAATPVQDFMVTLTGLPSPTAGKFGPHSSSFPLTILDSYDAQVVGIEVTQSVQPMDLPPGSIGNKPLHGTPVRYNGVPLAASGRTLVRVFPNLAQFPQSTPLPDFYCSLAGSRSGAPLPGGPEAIGPALNPLSLGPNFVDDATRAGRNKECDFLLPPSWTSGIISLTATISPVPTFFPPTSVECCLDNNSFTLTDIPFTPTRDLFLAPFALRVNQGALGFPDDIFAEAEKLLPIGASQLHLGDYVGEVDITDIWNQDVKACGFLGLDSCPEDVTGRGASVNARLRDFADDMNFTESGELVVGIFPQTDPVSGKSDRIRNFTNTGCTGPFWDCDDLQVMSTQNQLRPLTSVAHELGHMLGRHHASLACGAGDTDNNGEAEHWPPDERGYIQGVGVDRSSLRVWFPDRHGGPLGGPYYDFMSYCADGSNDGDPDSWISVRGWVEELNALSTGAPGSSARSVSVRPLATGHLERVLVVQAFVDLKGNVTVSKVASDLRPARTAAASSHFELTVLGPGDMILARQPMKAEKAEGRDLSGTVTFLSAQVPVAAADAIEIAQDGKPIARRNRDTLHVPRVADVDVRQVEADMACASDYRHSPHPGCGGELNASHAEDLVTVATWHTRYTGAAATHVKVDFSKDDGKTWRPIFYGPNHGTIVVRNATLPPTAMARIRVRLSDGFNEAAATSHRFRERGGKHGT